jgi:NADH-quinone oxidoreductase subunit N
MYFDKAEDRSVFQARTDTRVVLSLNGVAVLALGLLPGSLMALCISVIAAVN